MFGDIASKRRGYDGTEFDTLWVYSGSDARNIIWKRSTWTDIYEKKYYTHEGIDLHIIFEDDPSWWFEKKKGELSKYSWYDTLVREAGISMRKSGWKVTSYHRSQLQKIYKNSMLLFLSSSLRKEDYIFLKTVRKSNDVIVILLSHEIEKNTHWNIYESGILDRKYQEKREETIKQLKTTLAKSDIALIEWYTDDTPSNLLNHFFRTRYAR